MTDKQPIPRLSIPGQPAPLSARAPDPNNSARAGAVATPLPRLLVPVSKPAPVPPVSPSLPPVSAPAKPQSYIVRAPALPDRSGRDDLDRIAGQSVGIARDALTGGGVGLHTKRARDAVQIGTKVVGAMRSRARDAVSRDNAAGADPDAIAALWTDLVAGLADMGLDPAIYCARSGRLVQRLDVVALYDYLHAVARLGDTRAGDAALGAVQQGLIAQIGNTTLPQYLTISADRLAFERELLPADFLIRALGKLFPAPSDNLGRAIHAQRLGGLRLQACALPPAVLHYLCEVVTLHLSHIDCAAMPRGRRLDSLYPGGDWSNALATVAAAGHLAGRMVQHIFSLLASRDNKPLERLSRFDLLNLRTTYRGHPEYGSTYRRTRAQYSNLARAAMVQSGMSRRDIDLADAASAAFDLMGPFDFGMADLLDLQAAGAMSGHAIGVHLQTQADLSRAQATRAQSVQAARAATLGFSDDAAPDDLAGALASLDLSGLLASDYLPDDFVTLDDERDFVRQGIITADDLFDVQEALLAQSDDADFDFDDTPAESLTFAESDALQAQMIAAAIAEAKPVWRK